MKKIITIFLVAVLIVSFSIFGIGCKAGTETAATETAATTTAKVTEEAKPVTIKIWDWQVMENYMAAFKEIIGLYEKAHPNVTIERKTYAEGEFQKQIKAALSGNEAPDLFQIKGGLQTTEYYKSGILYDFTDDWNADPEWQKMLDVFNPKASHCVIDGKLIKIAFIDEWIHAMYYYKDMLPKYGFKKPETIKDLIALAPILNNNNIIPTLIGFGSNSISWNLPPLLNELMMQKLGPDVVLKLDSGEISWEDPIVKESFTAFKDMFEGKVFAKDVNSIEYFPDVIARFQNKEAWSFFPAGDWTIGSMNKEDVANDNIGVMPIPKLSTDSKTGYASMVAIAYGMLKDDPNKDVIIDIAKFFLSKEAAEILVKNNIHPASNLAADISIENNLMKAVIKESTNPDYFYSPYQLSRNSDIGNRLVEDLGKFINKIMTIDEVCADMEQFTNKLLGK